MIQEEMSTPDLPEFVLMNRDDIYFLLDIIETAEEMAVLVDHSAQRGSKSAKRLLDRWNELLSIDV